MIEGVTALRRRRQSKSVSNDDVLIDQLSDDDSDENSADEHQKKYAIKVPMTLLRKSRRKLPTESMTLNPNPNTRDAQVSVVGRSLLWQLIEQRGGNGSSLVKGRRVTGKGLPSFSQSLPRPGYTNSLESPRPSTVR
mmetsp:Transcript_36503/g.59053  ORF Transcript_36503/g.59053 Transcript_36503/m.59053 type:complete len:137 (-) Transcript_36503:100-510(-)